MPYHLVFIQEKIKVLQDGRQLLDTISDKQLIIVFVEVCPRLYFNNKKLLIVYLKFKFN